MKATNKILLRAALVAGALVAVAGTYAFTFTLQDNTKLPLKWPAGPIPIRIALGDTKTLLDGSNYNTSARAAAQAWNALLGSAQLQSTLVPGPGGTAADNNDVNELHFASKMFDRDFGEDTLAITTGYSSGNERVEADITFNTAYTWDSYRGNVRPNLQDLQRVALHELGHLLGLGHPDEATPKQTVNAIMNSRVGNLDTVTADDTQGGQSLYGPPGTPANDAFANATVITLTTGNTTSLKGYNTNATREPSEPLNAGNAGGRSVWWRWTAPSSGSVTVDTGKVDAATQRIDLSDGKSSYYDTTLGVYTGNSVGALTQIASNDDIDTGVVQASTVTFNVTGGTTYSISVDGWDADNGGITLHLAFTSVGGTLPSITTQPTGSTVSAGASVSF
ncbi:MAG TPA: matrixin family metalloprotease, partial [Lacunisphaera sp.]|nr:matrixin family metalloprotease [Lacunisphaera sp.]